MSGVLNLVFGVLQWLLCLFVIPLYLDYRRLRRRLEHLEEASRWRELIEGGCDPRNYEGWHEFKDRALRLDAGRDVVYLGEDKTGGILRGFPTHSPKYRKAI